MSFSMSFGNSREAAAGQDHLDTQLAGSALLANS
jgi:hypothetical protein